MLLKIAIGDAYGAGFEYVSPKFVADHNDLSRYFKHPKHGILAGQYTDDTQMSLAIAETLLSDKPWTKEALAEAFVHCFKRDQRPGYAGRFYDFLLSVVDGADFLARIQPNSDKSGAAMRAAPIGILSSIDEIKDKCALQAAITHNTTDGINAAVAASLATHYFAYKLGSKSGLGSFLDKHVPGDWSSRWSGKVGEKGWMSVRAAVTALTECRKFSDLLKTCISYGGDVDTVAAVACGAAAHCDEIEQDVPQVLIDGLENDSYGRDYIVALDTRLTNRLNELRAANKTA